MPTYRSIASAAVFGLCATSVCALDDRHLDFVPRSETEAARVGAVIAPPTEFSQPQAYEARTAGAATVPVRADNQPFKQPSANLDADSGLDFRLGEAMFEKLWVSAPSSTLASDGLGPLYNARACQSCHLRGGRGHAPDGPEDDAISFALKLSVPGTQSEQIYEIEGFLATRPEPTYGTQLQDFSLPGHPAEARIETRYETFEVALSGGQSAELRRPIFEVKDLGYGPLDSEVMISPRVAPQMIGLGLLEAIPAVDILAGEDPEDVDGDGVSGRANIVWSVEYQRPMLGRFGLKAGAPTLRQQTAGAFAADIGISTSLFPAGHGDCSSRQEACVTAPHGDKDVRNFEVDDAGLALTTFYSANLAVPARRNVGDAQVLRGKELFHSTGCASCHTPNFVTHRLPNQPAQSFQLIWPYTDMLLHDMGAGLADGRPEARATGREWRTPPLWGVGLTKRVSGHSHFLHDGRARSLLEAVLWHGGEAEVMKTRVIDMPPADRAALIRFLESL
ncbi:di-heme oxidoredictase family protein [Shimia sp.]|uniref:di-heme oxidoreductase family protein n=1 Tax=Shimia sp. TaxID=1954381 RepID=UPI003B8E67D9